MSSEKVTYKEPNDKSMVTIIFIDRFICVCQRTIAGRTAQARSVAMVLAVDMYDKPSMAVMGEH